MNSPLKRILLFLGIAVFITVGGGCSSYSKLVKKIRKDIYQKRYEDALKELDESSIAKSEKDSLIYYMDKGTLLFLLHRYDKSLNYFQKAKDRVDQLFATSVHKQAESFLSNNLALPYKGEDFERVLIHYYMALDYLMKNDLENALVESRQVILYLDEINDKYKKKNIYHDDAFVRYLNGVLFENGSEYNDAYVEYYDSWKAFRKIYKRYYHVKVPLRLYRDLKRLATFLDMSDDLKMWQEKFSGPVMQEPDFVSKKAEVIVIVETGFIPRKKEGKLNFLLGTRWVKIVFPKYGRDHPSEVKYVVLDAGDKEDRDFLLEPLAEIARHDLKDRAGRIMARMAARVALKHGLAEGAEELAKRSKNPYVRAAAGLIGFAGHIAASASEKADIRGWYTLPHDIHLVRLTLDPGKYNLNLKLYGSGGSELEAIPLGKISLAPGQRVFKYFRVPY